MGFWIIVVKIILVMVIIEKGIQYCKSLRKLIGLK